MLNLHPPVLKPVPRCHPLPFPLAALCTNLPMASSRTIPDFHTLSFLAPPPPPPQRFALPTTSSFKALEPHWKEELARLHNDYYYHRQVTGFERGRE